MRVAVERGAGVGVGMHVSCLRLVLPRSPFSAPPPNPNPNPSARPAHTDNTFLSHAHVALHCCQSLPRVSRSPPANGGPVRYKSTAQMWWCERRHPGERIQLRLVGLAAHQTATTYGFPTWNDFRVKEKHYLAASPGPQICCLPKCASKPAAVATTTIIACGQIGPKVS